MYQGPQSNRDMVVDHSLVSSVMEVVLVEERIHLSQKQVQCGSLEVVPAAQYTLGQVSRL